MKSGGVTPPCTDGIYLLGCGRSILDLSVAEREAIQRSRCVLALNKFILFHDVARITPTHVWFAEDHWPAPVVLRDIFAHCRRHRLKDLTFIVSPGIGAFHESPVRYARARVGRALRRFRGKPHWESYLVPRNSRFESVTKNDWLTGGAWATSPGQPLFHLRTSFTCALNYLALNYPGAHIRLIGTDFNSDGYFFQEQMRRFQGRWDDWTTAAQKEHKRHFAAIEHEGKTVFDAFPYMREQLDRAGIRLSCPNPDSEIVRRGLAEHESAQVLMGSGSGPAGACRP
jgi:hypothetical protein